MSIILAQEVPLCVLQSEYSLMLLKTVFLFALVLTFVLSALAVIESKYHSRLLFIDIQAQEKQLDNYEVTWGQSQLELTMLMEENRVELIGKQQFKLVLPQQQNIVYLKP